MSTTAWNRTSAVPICFIALALFVSAAPAHAETIYKSTGPDGEITYSSQPVAGSRESEVLDIHTLSPEQRRAARVLRAQDKALSAQVNAELNARDNEWRRVDREIGSAQKELVRAESALRKGRTPLAGERRGNAGGGSRLTEAYFQRLRQAELRVGQAHERQNRAYAARNALE